LQRDLHIWLLAKYLQTESESAKLVPVRIPGSEIQAAQEYPRDPKAEIGAWHQQKLGAFKFRLTCRSPDFMELREIDHVEL
jgi:hypothetical protein